MIGATVGHFEVLRELGRGGMGVVYEARDSRLGRLVAIKTVVAAPDAVNAARRLLAEARVVSNLAHPYICHVFDILDAPEGLLIVMERLHGETLQSCLARGPLELREAVRLAAQAAEGLREAHRHGVVHRDIKPSNLFLTEAGYLKILDFGLARTGGGSAVPGTDDRTVSDPITAPGTAMGTLGYMSPEQALGQPVDARTDIFALGAVVFESVTGTGPFAAPTPAGSFQKLFAGEPPSLRAVRPETAPVIAALVASMLARDPDARPRSMTDVCRALMNAGAGFASGTPAPSRSIPVPAPAVPPTRYARSGRISIAYQVVGDGPFDLVYVPGWISHLEYGWEEPRVAQFFRRLASFSRLILFDKRGTGLSDRVGEYPTLEDRMDDLRAVMDAVGSERAAVLGASEGGNLSVLFAATYPERVIALAVAGIFAKRVWSPDYPWAPTPVERQRWFDLLQDTWGGRTDIDILAPSLAGNERFVTWWSTYLRLGASPGDALALARFNTQIDIRNILPAVRVPTLVLHRTGDLDVKVDEGRYIASRIPGAAFVELPGRDHLVYAGDVDRLVAEIERFLTSVHSRPAPDCLLLTLMLAAASGSAGRDRLDPIVTELAPRYRGRLVRSAAHAPVVIFDGPARAIRCACALVTAGRQAGLDPTAVVHTGECDLRGDELDGGPVAVAAELLAEANPGDVLVTGTVRDLVAGSRLVFESRGTRKLRSQTGAWPVFAAGLIPG